MTPNTALKAAIFESGRTQQVVAREAEMHASKLSRVIRGHEEASQDEKVRLAAVLGRPVHDLFSRSPEALAS